MYVLIFLELISQKGDSERHLLGHVTGVWTPLGESASFPQQMHHFASHQLCLRVLHIFSSLVVIVFHYNHPPQVCSGMAS